jgi:hypothetical protein
MYSVLYEYYIYSHNNTRLPVKIIYVREKTRFLQSLDFGVNFSRFCKITVSFKQFLQAVAQHSVCFIESLPKACVFVNFVSEGLVLA